MGAVVAIRGSGGSILVQAAEMVTPDRFATFRQLGLPVLAITARRAETLKARAYDGDIARLRVPADADCRWVRATADPAQDMTFPMKGPYASERDGSADTARAAIALCKSAHLLPAAMIVQTEQAAALALESDLTCLEAEMVRDRPSVLTEVSAARVPTTFSGHGRVHVFRPDDGGEEHYVVEIGTPERPGPVLARLHSACFTGDVLGSLKCDCGPQLRAALQSIGDQGSGVLLYLNQEGRGIGLANKMRAYALQDAGFDTVEANHRLGFEDDERDFRIGAEILKRMGFDKVRLMTNNPAKVAMMQANGVTVAERVSLQVGRTPENAGYLDTKARKSGHIL